MQKICNICFDPKDLDQFGRYRRSKDGYDNRCKQCKKEYRLQLGCQKERNGEFERRKETVVISESWANDKVFYLWRSTHEQIIINLDSEYQYSSRRKIFDFEKMWILENYPHWKEKL